MVDVTITRARGAVYLSAQEFVRQRFGPQALARVIAALSPADAAVVEAVVSPEQWAPMAAWISLIETTDRLLGAGDLALAVESGAWAARIDLPKLYPELPHDGAPDDIVTLASRFWRSYYDGGRAEAVATADDDEALFEVVDFPAPSRAHCHRVMGWIGGAFSVIGMDVEMSMPSCRAEGGERCLYVARGAALRGTGATSHDLSAQPASVGVELVDRAGRRRVSRDALARDREHRDLFVDAVRCVIVAGERTEAGKPTSARILARLIAAQGQCVPADALYREVWGAAEYHPLRHRNTLYVAINRLRKLLHRMLEGREVIETTPAGWRIADDVDACVAFDDAPAA